jgi:biotin carboxylase
MRVTNIWLSQPLASAVHVIAAIRSSCESAESVQRFVTHVKADHPTRAASNYFALEPGGLSKSDYIDYCLQFAQRLGVDYFFPRSGSAFSAATRARFEKAGVRLSLCADEAVLRCIKNKGKLYQALAGQPVPLPEYRLVNDGERFRQACGELLATARRVCFKPTTGFAGRGFHVIVEPGEEFRSSWDGTALGVTVDQAVAMLSAGKNRFPELMVMSYLAGPERSVDCLAQNGALLRAIVRVKSFDGSYELLERNQEVEQLTSRLTEHFRLDGLYNVQFMEDGGRYFLLEINCRMSGGIHYGALSGVCLPYWAVRLALGTATVDDIPIPLTGLRVARATRTILS